MAVSNFDNSKNLRPSVVVLVGRSKNKMIFAATKSSKRHAGPRRRRPHRCNGSPPKRALKLADSACYEELWIQSGAIKFCPPVIVDEFLRPSRRYAPSALASAPVQSRLRILGRPPASCNPSSEGSLRGASGHMRPPSALHVLHAARL